GKPVGINRFIGRYPIFAFGNSDGDLQMLQCTAAHPGARFMGIVHHTDAEREYAYDRNSRIGRLDKAWTKRQSAVGPWQHEGGLEDGLSESIVPARWVLDLRPTRSAISLYLGLTAI